MVSSAVEILEATHLILPGVGAFPYAMKLLRENGLNQSILEFSKNGRPILGICLGLQLLFEKSTENGLCEGLSLLKGRVDRYKQNKNFRIPQIQWNQLIKRDSCPIMTGIKNKEYFYFANSYCVDVTSLDKNYNIYISKYANQQYLSLIEYKNIIGVQFHPEKSGKSGLKLIGNFIKK
jgi:glutamine amidotransferase